MNQFSLIKENIYDEISNAVSSIKNIISTTIVGSFVNSIGLKGISDIDIVIIVDELNKKLFDEINNSFQLIESAEIGLENYEIIINNTFGPLKLDNEKSVVFHIMIYDILGHVEHVEKSPFTCHSWENFTPIQGISLKEVYPVLNLQLYDIIQSRRSVSSYMNDIENGSISYRKYLFKDNKADIIKENFKLDSKHKLEYSYHITYHLLNNLYKIITRANDSLPDRDLIDFYIGFELLPDYDIFFFEELFIWKKGGGLAKGNSIEKVKLFITDFFSCLKKIKSSSNIISIRRHGKTDLNDGTFLGIRRNPSIKKISRKISEFNYHIGYHSEMLRSKETIRHYNTNKKIESNLLNEIDYGLAEGLKFDQLNQKFPKIIKEWEKGKDPNFPEGENQRDVLDRVREFIDIELKFNLNTLIMTHLVVIRMFLFFYIKVNFSSLYKIKIDHLEGFNLLCFKKFISTEINEEVRRKIRKQLSILND